MIYTRTTDSLDRREPPDDIDKRGNNIRPACQLAFRESWDLPSGDDKLPDMFASDMKILREDKRWEPIHEVRMNCHAFSHHLLGYSFHFCCGSDPSPGPEWRNLLRLSSDDNLGWNWCDGMHLAVSVHEEDLQSSTFARIHGYAS